MQQEFAIPFRAENRGFDDLNLAASQLQNDAGNFVHRRLLSLRVAHDPALADLLPPDFELWFDQDHRFEISGRRANTAQHRRENECSRDE